jgi:2-polyprenyl-3-methyl-5-hydroxy-6-metoxy-1,4-benzoquinol methylase
MAETKNNNSLPPHLSALEARLIERYPYFAKVVSKRFDDFGELWVKDFENELSMFFRGDFNALNKATDGYGIFALDAMKLQKRFDKELEYIPKSYADVAAAVYHSQTYMFDLYLPGILLSQFLWHHHYQQLKFFRESFVPLARSLSAKSFYDVGVGTGFYSKEMLQLLPDVKGTGCDISEHSLSHTSVMLERWGHKERYQTRKLDILKNSLSPVDCVVSVEVLEHLEDPPTFLRALYGMLRKDGVGYITAAINAPNADHIYLYRSISDVLEEIKYAGFKILKFEEYLGYIPKQGETAPSGGVCIVTKE